MTNPRRQIVTASDVHASKGILRVAPDALITPLAADAAQSLGIRIERALDPPPAASAGSPREPAAALNIASRIDHTLLAPAASQDEVRALCSEAEQHGFAAVCVLPVHVRLASECLSGRLPVCSVAGFPTGGHRSAVKSQEAAQSVQDGAGEVDLVARHDLLRSAHYQCYADDIAAVRNAVGPGVILKVIIEAPLLTPEEVVRACALAAFAGADFLKTSTGVYAQARAEDVRLMRRACPPQVRIKAAGGIRTLGDALAMLEAGADRLGTSASVAICSESQAGSKSRLS